LLVDRLVRSARRFTAVLFAAAFFTASSYADLVIPAGASLALNGGTTDLVCTDLIVAGTLTVDSGSVTGIRNVNIQAGGSVVVTSGTLSLSGDWSNAGNFAAGSGLVRFVDLAGCATSGGTISGNTSFAQLSFVTSIGKTYAIASNSTQTITQQLTIQGAPGLPLVLRGSTAGQPAFLALGGGQTISNFGAADLVAVGNWVAPNQSNAINGTGVIRIFGDPNVPVPTMPLGALALLALALAALVRKRVSAT
jgi:MYXO-CTERM domain-containing protein